MLWLANEARTDVAATQDKSSALTPDPSSGDLGWFAFISNHKTRFYQLLYLGPLSP